jgi:hypothetical protein
MPEYRTIKNARTLKGTAIEVDDENLSGGVDSAIGLDTPDGMPDAQLDIRYRGGNTYVSLAVDSGKGQRVPQEHWRFAGLISPEDCRTNWKAAQEKATVAVETPTAESPDDQPHD